MVIKRVGYIYERICDAENIKKAILKASLGKRSQNGVKHIMRHADEAARRIQQALLAKNYKPSPYITKTIRDGANQKERVISKPRFYPDQIIHWALMLQLEPIMMRGMYEYSCGSVPGRGTSYGQKTIRRWLDKDPKGTKYCLKMDIAKFYPSVDNETLKTMFRRVVKDPACLWLVDTVVDSAIGLPIGNYTSQWFANFYLQELDHLIKEKLGAKYYIRYVDDLILLGPNKKKLHAMRREVEVYLESIKLKLKGSWQVFRVSDRAIDFLGFRFYRNKTLLRKRNALRIRRRVRKIGKKDRLNYRDACAIISYWGWIKRSNSFNFYNKHVKPVITLRKARKAVSRYARLRNNTKK